jgi:eukaryotic-like serine/threonine-protein kinase
MTPARPDVKAIFSEALRIPEEAARAAYLDRACGGDTGLRLRVEVLLAAHARADDVLGPAGATSVGDPATTGHDPGAAEAIGPTTTGLTMGRPEADATGPATAPASDRDAETLARPNRVRYFGDYEIRRELGRGGMGVVYEARQVSLNRAVALKMVRAGLLAGDDDLRRFKNEAEAVALLDHPGIVPVYEVGAHDSQHYFSMKLVPGGSLVALMPRYRDDPRAAARLAAEAAEAVAHAHARGILHRDLKPANILVDDQGRPHVTDFGLAKKVESDVEITQSGAVLGTPAYMSPEQASGRRGAVTTASDVYGLGAVLYALLTGRAPFGGDSVVETIDAVRNRLPEPPRQLNAALPRDLETICLRCLEKDPRRRYPTAQALADDLRAWLDNRPIAARRVGPAERAWLWCRRRPAVAALSAAVALAVVGGVAATIAVQYAANRRLDDKNAELDRANLGLLEAIRDKDQANSALAEANIRVQARFDLARDAIRSLKQGVEEEEALKEDRLRPLRDKLLGSARRFYDRLGELLRGQTDDASKAVLAESYTDLGKLIDEIGQKPEALEAYRKAMAIRRELAAAAGSGPAARVELARSLNGLGEEAFQLADHAGALAAHEEARSLAEPLATGPAASIEARRVLGYAHERAGLALEATGAHGRALAAHRQAREVYEPLVREATALPKDRLELADITSNIGALLEQAGDLDGALAEQQKARKQFQALVAEHPAVPEYRRELAVGHIRVALLLEATGELAGALAEFRVARELFRALAAEHPAVIQYRRDLAVSHNRVGILLDKMGDLDGALAEQRRSQEQFRALAAEHPAVPSYRSDVAVSHNQVGGLLAKTGDLNGALAEYRKQQELFRALVAEHAEVPVYRHYLAITHNKVGSLLEQTGDTAGALAEHRRSHEFYRALAAEHPEVPDNRRDLAVSHTRVGALLTLSGRPAQALPELELARSLLEDLAQAGPNVPDYRDRLAIVLTAAGDALRDLGRPGEARDRLARAVALAEELASAQPKVPAYRALLAGALRRLARLKLDADGAIVDARRAVALLEGLPSRDGGQWFGLACARATLSAAAGRDWPGLSAGEAPGLAGRAMDDLRRAAAIGWRNPALYRYEPALGLLRARDDFRELMRDLNFPADPFARGE